MKVECSPEVVIPVVRLYYKTKLVVFLDPPQDADLVACSKSFTLIFIKTLWVTLLRSTQREAANQPWQPAAAAWEAGRDAMESLAGEIPMALKEWELVKELDTPWTVRTHDQVYK